MQTSPNDRIRIATIGVGGMGSGDTRMALSVPGVELVAVCDVYDGRLARAREVWGNQVAVTRDHREILARRDIDAVIIATPDHWHAAITREALAAGKHVYCEKPMVQRLDEGKPVIEAQRSSGKIMQVGSQYVSSMVYLKARDLYRQGVIGELNMVEAWLDRNSALGAWQYSIPLDASPATVDWDRFLGRAPKRPFEAMRLFRWRNYRDYGTGVGGDLFVHLLSGLHTVTGALGPTRVYAAGGIRFWRDGRDVPDVVLATLDYPKTERHPEFTLALRVNLASGGVTEDFGFRFVGSEGVMTTSMNSVKLSRHPQDPEPGYTIETFAQPQREAFLADYRRRYPPRKPSADGMRPDSDQQFVPPRSHNAHLEHHRRFYASLRGQEPPVEDPVFGFRAAGPALLANASCFEKRVCKWDPENMVEG